MPLATIIAALIIAIGTPIFGIFVYFRQKEVETVKRRYLDDGISYIIRQVEYGQDVFSYNWAHSLNLLKTYRDLGHNTPPDLYKSGFLSIGQPLSLESSRHYLLKEIIGDDIFWIVQQFMSAFLHDADNFFRVDLCSAIRVSLEGGKGDTTIARPKEIFEMYVEELKKKKKESDKYYYLLGNLQIIETSLSKKHYTYKSLHKFRCQSEVIKAIADLKKTFKNDIARHSSHRPK